MMRIRMLIKRRGQRSEHGAAIILMSMALVLLIFSIVLAQIQLQNLNTRTSTLLTNDTQSRDAARAGLDMALSQLSTSGMLTSGMTECEFYRSGLPNSLQITGASVTDDPCTPEQNDSATITVPGPSSYLLGNGCVTWWYGLYDDNDTVATTDDFVRLHVMAAAPYVHQPDETPGNPCSLATVVGTSTGDTSLNPQRGSVYLVTAIVSAAQPAAGATPTILSANFDKRTFNL